LSSDSFGATETEWGGDPEELSITGRHQAREAGKEDKGKFSLATNENTGGYRRKREEEIGRGSVDSMDCLRPSTIRGVKGDDNKRKPFHFSAQTTRKVLLQRQLGDEVASRHTVGLIVLKLLLDVEAKAFSKVHSKGMKKWSLDDNVGVLT